MRSKQIKKIYLVWNYLQWGGAQIYFLSIVKQASEDFKFILVVPRKTDEDILKFFEPYNVEFEFVDTFLDISKATGIWEKIKRKYRQIHSEIVTYRHFAGKKLVNSIIHIEYAPWQSWILLSRLAKLTNVIVTIHNALPKNSSWREFIWSKRLNFLLGFKTFQIFAANQNTIDNFKEKIKPKYWHKLKLTRACINPNQMTEVADAEFELDQLLKKHNLPTDKFIVLCVGQFVDRKGRWIFLESAREISRNHSDLIFVWLMPHLPNDEENLQIQNYKVENFYPIRSADAGSERIDVLNFFRIADVFALPSLLEGLPITLLEAMALGICSISTNITAIPEAVKNMETGVLIESGNSRELTDAIFLLKNDEKLKENLAKNGKEFILKNFDEEYWANVALEEYRKCLEDD